MSERRFWKTPQKVILSILFGIASLLASPYGMKLMLGSIQIDLPWSCIFPIFIALAYGWRYSVISAIAGGALFPFYLWPIDGWANVTTSIMYLFLFYLLGVAAHKEYFTRLSSMPLRIVVAVVTYLSINYIYDTVLFNHVLSLNPSFWTTDAIRHIPQDIIYGFFIKDSVNIIALTLFADTLLRVPILRKLIGLPVAEAMKSNTFIFFTTLFLPLIFWLAFIGLGAMLLRGNNVLQYEHKSFALLIILTNGFLVARLLFYFSETQFFIQSKLNESEEQYRLIFENVQDVVYQMDLDGIVLNISPSVYAMIGYTRAEIVGNPSTCLYATDEERNIHLHLLSAEGALQDYEVTVRTKAGVFKHVSVNSRIIYDAQGKPHHIDGVIRDLTERKKYAMQMETKNQQLEIKNKELEQFAYIASHDLQEPLLTLMSVSDSLSKEYKNKFDLKADQYIDFISKSSARMQELVKELLNYARIGKSEVLSKVNCQEIVEGVVSDMKSYIATSQAKITFHDLPIVDGYALELKELFAQLIGNAIKFSKPSIPPEVTISAKKQVGFWLFSVEDNGIGIHLKDQEKIFMIFKRLHNRNEYGGTGIGLSHCKKIVALHGGNISVYSTPGKGSTFNFTIPRL